MTNYARARHFNRALSPVDAARVRAALGLAVPPPWTDAALDAVAAWQVAQGLVGDGMVGPRTLAALPDAAQPLRRAVPRDLVEAVRVHPDEAWCVDLSANRPNVDLHRLRRETGCAAVIVKATEGAHFVDSTATPYAQAAAAAGMAVGAYFLPWPLWQGRAADMQAQAASFSKWWKAHGQSGKAGAWVDMEDGERFSLRPAREAWGDRRAVRWFADVCARVEDLIQVQVGLYSNYATLKSVGFDLLHRVGLIGERPLWYAYYPSSGGMLPTERPPEWDGDWDMWQLTSKAQLPGYDKGCDLNLINRKGALYRAITGVSSC